MKEPLFTEEMAFCWHEVMAAVFTSSEMSQGMER